MPDYAIVENDTVTNVIVAPNATVAQSVSGGSIVRVTDGSPGMGWSRVNGDWRPPAPYASWLWNEGAWIPPVPRPAIAQPLSWNEEAMNWVPLDEVTDDLTDA